MTPPVTNWPQSPARGRRRTRSSAATTRSQFKQPFEAAADGITVNGADDRLTVQHQVTGDLLDRLIWCDRFVVVPPGRRTPGGRRPGRTPGRPGEDDGADLVSAWRVERADESGPQCAGDGVQAVRPIEVTTRRHPPFVDGQRSWCCALDQWLVLRAVRGRLPWASRVASPRAGGGGWRAASCSGERPAVGIGEAGLSGSASTASARTRCGPRARCRAGRCGTDRRRSGIRLRTAFLDGARKDVHAAHVEHVVRSAGDAEPPRGAAAGAGLGAGDRDGVAAAVAHERLAFPLDVRADQLARRALGDRQPNPWPGRGSPRTRRRRRGSAGRSVCSHWRAGSRRTSDRPKLALRTAKPQALLEAAPEVGVVEPRLAAEQRPMRRPRSRGCRSSPRAAPSRAAPDTTACTRWRSRRARGSPRPAAARVADAERHDGGAGRLQVRWSVSAARPQAGSSGSARRGRWEAARRPACRARRRTAVNSPRRVRCSRDSCRCPTCRSCGAGGSRRPGRAAHVVAERRRGHLAGAQLLLVGEAPPRAGRRAR